MIRKELPAFGLPVEKISWMDGCKIYFPEGWIIVRFSGTEPRVRIFAEADTLSHARELVAVMARFIDLPFEA